MSAPFRKQVNHLDRDTTEAIVVHHSGGPVDQTREEIYQYHVRPNTPTMPEWYRRYWPHPEWKPGRGFNDIGYHALVGKGVLYQGRPEGAVGAHSLGWNDRSIAICFIGDYSEGLPDGATLDVGVSLIKDWMEEYGIPVDRVIGHGESAKEIGAPSRSCPGPFLAQEIRRRIRDTEVGSRLLYSIDIETNFETLTTSSNAVEPLPYVPEEKDPPWDWEFTLPLIEKSNHMADLNLKELAALAAVGKAKPFFHRVEGFTLEDGSRYMVDHQGRVWQGHVVVRNVDGVLITGSSHDEGGPLREIADQVRRGAAGILVLLNHPLARIVENILGRDLDKVRGIVEALDQQGTARQVTALVAELGHGRLQAISQAVNEAQKDGLVSMEELNRIYEVAKGK